MKHIYFWLLLSAFVYNPLSAQKKSSEKLNKWLQLATEYRFNQPDSTRFYCQKILSEAHQTENQTIIAETLRIMSISYEAQGDYKKALDYGLKSLELWREIKDDVKIANTLNTVGIIYDQQGNFYKALQYYNEAYDIYKKLANDEHLAMMNINLGILFKSQGQYKQVIQHYKDAYTIYKRLEYPAEIAFCEANLGSVYYYTKQYDSCIHFSLKAEKALLEQKNLQFMPVVQANAGLGYLELGKLKESEKYLQKALKTHRQYGNKKEISFVLIHLARLYEKQNQNIHTYQSLKEAKELALFIKSPQQVIDASKLLSDYYLKKGDYKNAYNEFVTYSSVKDTLFEEQKTREISNYQVRYETEKKEQEISRLTQENKIQQLNIQQRNLYLFITSLLIIGAIITIVQIYRIRKLKEKKLKQEAELLRLESRNTLQNDRLRISKDLHDNIGANLTFIHTAIEDAANENTEWKEVKNLIDDTITELRRTVWLINKPSVRLDEWLIKLKEYYSKIRKTEVETEINNEELILSSKQATLLFRIIQEAVNNSLKHSKASNIRIIIKANQQNCTLTILDNGKGFSENAIRQGFGLENMKQNAQELNGTFSIESYPNKGTEISIWFSF